MTSKSDPTPNRPSVNEAEWARLQSRRRFTRAGLSAPIVLGTLASKPVLGQSGPPYNCTISGQVSGNLSHPGDANCSKLGSSASVWLGASTWPSPLVKGPLPNQNCNFSGPPNVATPFSPTFVEAFKYRGAGSGSNQVCEVLAYDEVDFDKTSGVATMHQVLNLSATTEVRRLGRAAVTSLLNAYAKVPKYPLTPRQVVEMVNAVMPAGGLYWINSTASWNRTQVITYLESLYPA